MVDSYFDFDCRTPESSLGGSDASLDLIKEDTKIMREKMFADVDNHLAMLASPSRSHAPPPPEAPLPFKNTSTNDPLDAILSGPPPGFENVHFHAPLPPHAPTAAVAQDPNAPFLPPSYGTPNPPKTSSHFHQPSDRIYSHSYTHPRPQSRVFGLQSEQSEQPLQPLEPLEPLEPLQPLQSLEPFAPLSAAIGSDPVWPVDADDSAHATVAPLRISFDAVENNKNSPSMSNTPNPPERPSINAGDVCEPSRRTGIPHDGDLGDLDDIGGIRSIEPVGGVDTTHHINEVCEHNPSGRANTPSMGNLANVGSVGNVGHMSNFNQNEAIAGQSRENGMSNALNESDSVCNFNVIKNEYPSMATLQSQIQIERRNYLLKEKKYKQLLRSFEEKVDELGKLDELANNKIVIAQFGTAHEPLEQILKKKQEYLQLIATLKATRVADDKQLNAARRENNNLKNKIKIAQSQLYQYKQQSQKLSGAIIKLSGNIASLNDTKMKLIEQQRRQLDVLRSVAKDAKQKSPNMGRRSMSPKDVKKYRMAHNHQSDGANEDSKMDSTDFNTNSDRTSERSERSGHLDKMDSNSIIDAMGGNGNGAGGNEDNEMKIEDGSPNDWRLKQIESMTDSELRQLINSLMHENGTLDRQARMLKSLVKKEEERKKIQIMVLKHSKDKKNVLINVKPTHSHYSRRQQSGPTVAKGKERTGTTDAGGLETDGKNDK